jgi:gamma-glutamylcyclotransferase (GGCT)/AIG2-like uncharacterized protein YtfP
MNSDFLFVYGTLCRKASNKMTAMLAEHAQFISYASYQGKLYKVDDYPGVIPSDNPNDLVQGEVYQFHEADLLLNCLDLYEECGQGFPEPTEYVRNIGQVHLSSGKDIRAWLYLYNWPTENLILLPSGIF